MHTAWRDASQERQQGAAAVARFKDGALRDLGHLSSPDIITREIIGTSMLRSAEFEAGAAELEDQVLS